LPPTQIEPEHLRLPKWDWTNSPDSERHGCRISCEASRLIRESAR
jgi:hypothetical protein